MWKALLEQRLEIESIKPFVDAVVAVVAVVALGGGGRKCFYLPVASDGRLMKPSRTMEKIAHEGMIRQTNKETETKNHR